MNTKTHYKSDTDDSVDTNDEHIRTKIAPLSTWFSKNRSEQHNYTINENFELKNTQLLRVLILNQTRTSIKIGNKNITALNSRWKRDKNAPQL